MHNFDEPCSFPTETTLAIDARIALPRNDVSFATIRPLRRTNAQPPQPQPFIVETVGGECQYFRIVLTSPEGVVKDLTTVDDRTTHRWYRSAWASPHWQRSRVGQDPEERLDPIWFSLWREYEKADTLKGHFVYLDRMRKMGGSAEERSDPKTEVKGKRGVVGRALQKCETKVKQFVTKGLRRKVSVFSVSKKCGNL